MFMNHIVVKYKKMSQITKASLWYAICNIMQKGIAFIVIPIYTRVLSTTEYGQYSVFQSWCNILIIFATLNLYCGVFTKAMVDFDDDKDRYTSSMQGLSTILTSVLFVIYIIFHVFWNKILGMDTFTVVLMFIYFVTFPAFSFWSVRQRVEYKYKKMVIVTLITSVMTPVVSIALLVYTTLRANAVIWGFLITQCLVGLFFYIFHFIRGKVFYNSKYWLYGLKFNIPLVPHYLSLIVLGQADRIMIEKFCGSEKTGIYNLAYQVSMLMNVFINAINSTLVPWTYQKLKENDFPSIKVWTRKLCVLIGLMTMGAILVAPEIIRFLGTKEYMSAIWIIPAVAISVYFTFCYGLYSNVEFYFESTHYVMIASVIGATLNVVLNAIYIPLYGFIAAGYTTMVCYLLFMIMHFLFMKKICFKSFNGELIYDNFFIFISCIVLSIISAICMVLYRVPMFRYAIILIVAIFIVLERKKIFELISNFRGKK